MSNLKKFLAVGLLVTVTGCSCHAHRAEQAGSNALPIPEEGKELKDVHFAFDSYELSPVAQQILQQNANWLKTHSGSKVVIEGHCDERGTNQYNMVLGANRARSVEEYERSLGVETSRMSTISYGEENPLDPGHNEEAWAKNRRAHFRAQ
jgi:peptidoglycan-associated lipoprotein